MKIVILKTQTLNHRLFLAMLSTTPTPSSAQHFPAGGRIIWICTFFPWKYLDEREENTTYIIIWCHFIHIKYAICNENSYKNVILPIIIIIFSLPSSFSFFFISHLPCVALLLLILGRCESSQVIVSCSGVRAQTVYGVIPRTTKRKP